MVISKFKRLYTKDETVPDARAAGDDEGNTSTAVVEYEQPRLVSSSKRQKSSDYQKSREYRGSNLSSGSRRLASESQRKSADNVIDAKYTEVDDETYDKVLESMKKSKRLRDVMHESEPYVEEDNTPATTSPTVMKSPTKRPSAKSLTKSPSKRPSEGLSTQKSSKKRVTDAKDPEPDFSLDDQRRIWARYDKVEDETCKKVNDAREDAEYSLGMRKAKLRGQQRGIDLDDVEEFAYQAEANRRETEQLKKDVRKAQEHGINRATPFPERVAKQGKAAGKVIVEGFKEIDKATATFAQSRIGKNIAKTNEATLRGMQAAGDRALGSIGVGKKSITPSALNKPREFGSSSTTNPAQKITTRTVRHGKNNVVLYFDQYGRQISAAAARAYVAGKIPAQKPVQIPAQKVNQHTVAPFAVGRSGIPFAVGNYRAPFAFGHYQAPFVAGTYEAPFAAGQYQPPFAVRSQPTLVVGGYNGNPIGNIRRFGNPLGDIHRQGNPLGNTVRVSDPIGMIRREGNPLGNDERRGHTSRILRGQVKKEGNPLGESEKAGHTSRMVRADRRSKKPITKPASRKQI